MIEANISTEELKNIIDNEPQNLELIDVREPDEYDLIRLKNAKLIPMKKVLENLGKINWNKKVVFYCRTGSRSAYIGQNIRQKILNLGTGILDYYNKYPGEVVVGDRSLIDNYFK